MPELPDITIYIEALEKRLLGQALERTRVMSPFLLRTTSPALDDLKAKKVVELRRLGKRIAIGFEQEFWLLIHLMIAGRLHLLAPAPGSGEAKGSPIKGTRQAEFIFSNGMLVLTEAGTKRRASLHLFRSEAALQNASCRGLEVFDCTLAEFKSALTTENHTLKRSLTDPELFSGIGNGYSDEILHHARLSPVLLTNRLTDEQIERLYASTRETLAAWTGRLRAETGEGFPEKVTAFRPDMAVHGKFGQPCPVCGAKIQRIRYAENETNYCPHCQTGGKLLADRSLSLLLKKDWPKTPEELEEMRHR